MRELNFDVRTRVERVLSPEVKSQRGKKLNAILVGYD